MAVNLPEVASVLAVVAHPDDESFGLGASLDRFASSGAVSALLCFTKGEASSLGLSGNDLRVLRERELLAAAKELGLEEVRLLDHPDGALGAEPIERLAGEVESLARDRRAELLLVFDDGGITGHPDHRAATHAAVVAGRAMGVPVLGWAIESHVALGLNRELGTSFAGRRPSEIDVEISVGRERQLRAIALHASQSTDNAVLWRRLELQGAKEVFCWLERPAEHAPPLVERP